jgi:hypothetical protein
MVEAVDPFKLHITSMSYLYEVFEHLQLLGMGIWMHTHSVTTTDVSPDLGELAKSLGDARVQTIHFTRGTSASISTTTLWLRLYNLSNCIPHPCHTYEVFEHLQLLCIDTWMHTHTVTTTDNSPDLGELAEILGDARVQTIPLSYS